MCCCSQVRSPLSIRHRTCIATRQVLPDAQLLRCVVDPADTARVIADPARRLPGRGAWISPTREAFELAEKRRAFGRALRVSTPVDVSHVRQYIAEHAVKHADGPEIVRKTEH